jgi:hypothetical protein
LKNSQRIWLSQNEKLSKCRTFSTPENLKTIFKNLSKVSARSTQKSLNRHEFLNYNSVKFRKFLRLQDSQFMKKIQNRVHFMWRKNMAYNVGSYTQGRIAGDFLSSRKTARAERCPPKTTAAALDG